MDQGAIPLDKGTSRPPPRLLLVSGKGGVGKSSASIAWALRLAKTKRVLWLELGARSVLPELLGGAPAGHRPDRLHANVYPNLWCARLNPLEALRAYLREQLRVARLVRMAVENKVLARLWRAAPSVAEMATLNALWFASGRSQDLGAQAIWPDDDAEHTFQAQLPAGGFDHVVVDLPASGHAIAMLGVPKGTLGIMRMGALAERLSAIDKMLCDPAHTGVALVTTPEELPVLECLATAQSLRKRLGIPRCEVWLNRVIPAPLSPLQRQALLGDAAAFCDVSKQAEALRAMAAEAVATYDTQELWRRHLDAGLQEQSLAQQSLAQQSLAQQSLAQQSSTIAVTQHLPWQPMGEEMAGSELTQTASIPLLAEMFGDERRWSVL